MGKNQVREEFMSDGTWTCPAGVTQVRAKVYADQRIGNQATGTSCALQLTQGGDAYGMGLTSFGESGVNDGLPHSSPVIVFGGLKWRSLMLCDTSTIGLSTSGDLYGWGRNTNGQLATGNVTGVSFPTIAVGGLKFRSLGGVGMAIRTDGTAYGWGKNDNGNIGDGTVVAKSSPILVLGGLKWRMVAAIANSSSYGIDSNGNLYAWGGNQWGNLGLGDVIPRSSPVIVLGGLKWKWVGAGAQCTYGITVANDLYAWGNNSSGQLGLGDVVSRSSPVIVLGGLKWAQVASTGLGNLQSGVVGITTAGDAYAFGNNINGQLGLGDVVARSSPVIVLGSLKWRSIGTGYANSTLGIATNGSAYAWGLNATGLLGLGDILPRSSPVIVLGGFMYRAIDAGLVSDLILDVTPGVAYTVTMYAPFVQLGGYSLYTDETYVGSMQVKLMLEYSA